MKVFLSAFADEASKDFSGQINSLKQNNINYVELRKLDGINISKITLSQAEKYKYILDSNGIKVWSLGSPLAKQYYFKNIDYELEMAKHLCDLADVFECENIRAFSFLTFSKKHSSETVKSKLNEILGVLKNRKINYCLENDTGLYADKPERINEILDCFPDMKYIYDPANFIISGCNADETIDSLAGKAFYFHIKDAKGKKIVPSGFGNAKIDKLINSFDRNCVCTIEPHLFAFRGVKGSLTDNYNMSSSSDKFNLAVDSFKEVLINNGFAENDGFFTRNEDCYE